MKTNVRLGLVLLVPVFAMGMAACKDDEGASEPQFIENARLMEEGQTLSPGETVHLLGDGYWIPMM